MFPAELTRDMDFQKSEGDKWKVRTMHQENFFAVKRVEDEKVRVLELPYKGNRFSLYVILPDTKEGLQHLEGHLDGQVRLETGGQGAGSLPQTSLQCFVRFAWDICVCVCPLQCFRLQLIRQLLLSSLLRVYFMFSTCCCGAADWSSWC